MMGCVTKLAGKLCRLEDAKGLLMLVAAIQRHVFQKALLTFN
jgi:hypothetical protein